MVVVKEWGHKHEGNRSPPSKKGGQQVRSLSGLKGKSSRTKGKKRKPDRSLFQRRSTTESAAHRHAGRNAQTLATASKFSRKLWKRAERTSGEVVLPANTDIMVDLIREESCPGVRDKISTPWKQSGASLQRYRPRSSGRGHDPRRTHCARGKSWNQVLSPRINMTGNHHCWFRQHRPDGVRQ